MRQLGIDCTWTQQFSLAGLHKRHVRIVNYVVLRYPDLAEQTLKHPCCSYTMYEIVLHQNQAYPNVCACACAHKQIFISCDSLEPQMLTQENPTTQKNILQDDVTNKHHHDWPGPEGQQKEWIIYIVELWQSK